VTSVVCQITPALDGFYMCCSSQCKGNEFPRGARRKDYDKPAVTGSKYAFIKQHVPVVMMEHVRGLGKKGQIVHVKRGYARHNLVPKGLAVFGTWENIDAYADPELVEDPTLKGRVAAERGRLPFDWVDDIRLRFVRWARDDDQLALREPITTWDVLAELSSGHELDLLPSNIELPEGGIQRVGVHELPVRIAFRNPESAASPATELDHPLCLFQATSFHGGISRCPYSIGSIGIPSALKYYLTVFWAQLILGLAVVAAIVQYGAFGTLPSAISRLIAIVPASVSQQASAACLGLAQALSVPL